jgi:uncharacterized protein (UPF0297 family)
MLAVPVGAESPSHDRLINQAASFLEQLDQAQYGDAWHTMSFLFQDLNSQDQWLNRQQTIRTAYGALSARQLDDINYRQGYNLSPDGLYVVVKFNSGFTNKADTTESVILDCRSGPECSIREYIIR